MEVFRKRLENDRNICLHFGMDADFHWPLLLRHKPGAPYNLGGIDVSTTSSGATTSPTDVRSSETVNVCRKRHSAPVPKPRPQPSFNVFCLLPGNQRFRLSSGIALMGQGKIRTWDLRFRRLVRGLGWTPRSAIQGGFRAIDFTSDRLESVGPIAPARPHRARAQIATRVSALAD